ncbi:MAG: hypothetical protein IJ055_00590 [Oscillospiraceae bacterium]|nr:hypothetical protein [Oscillospiraceae bacterium]
MTKYQGAAAHPILTSEVILTDNRMKHIIERRGQSFYDTFRSRFAEVLSDPDYIFKDQKASTAMAAKAFHHEGRVVNIVVRLCVEGDDPGYKNSIITVIGENEKRFAQRLRNHEPIYKKLDKDV